MRQYVRTYLSSYAGLSRPTWMLAAVMLINRTGAMVLPFLGIYMTSQLGFSLKEAGWVLSCYGLGAVSGSVLGGWLTDKYGHFKIQVFSLLAAVPLFAALAFLTTLVQLAIGIFVLSLVTDLFRPANSVSISAYAKPENLTRAFSLNRMALNLGFSIGPALGGLLAAISYSLLFYGNAFSVGVAGIIFYLYFHTRSARKPKNPANTHTHPKGGISPWKDRPFMVFSVLCILYNICFYQLLSTLPLYYKEVYHLSDASIGLLLGFNGLVVFALEMFLVSISEKRLRSMQIIILGTALCGISFFVLLIHNHLWVLYLSMFILSCSEIFAMPFMATVAINRSHTERQGAYMGLNSLSFSSAHIISPALGTAVAARFGFDALWISTGVLCALTVPALWWNMKKMSITPTWASSPASS